MTVNAKQHDMRIAKSSGYVLIRDGAPVHLGEEWPDVATASADRSKYAVLMEDDAGEWAARVLHGVNEGEALDCAERFAKDDGIKAAYLARPCGTIGKSSQSTIWQRVRRLSANDDPITEPKAEKAYKEFHCQIKSKKAEGDELIIEGWANTKNQDRDEEVVQPKAFEATLSASMPSLSILFNHNTEYVCGRPLSVDIKPDGLWCRAKIARQTNPPQVRSWVEDGDVRAFSIRFIVLDDELDAKGVRNITKAELLEISLVAMPSNRESVFSIAKAAAFGSDLACTACHKIACDCDRRITFKHYPLAEPLAPWNWDEASAKSILRAGGWDLYRDAHALYHPMEREHGDRGGKAHVIDDESAFRHSTSYHLPHHALVDGELKTTLNGVFDALALIPAADVSDDEKRSAYSHLARHFEEFTNEALPAYGASFDLDALRTKHCASAQSEVSQPVSMSVEPESKMAEPNPSPVVATSAQAPAQPTSSSPSPSMNAPTPAASPAIPSHTIDAGLIARMDRFINTPDSEPVDLAEYGKIAAEVQDALRKAAAGF